MPEHIFQNFAYAHLKEAISASATQMTLLPGDVEQWLERWEAGEIFHLTLLDNRNRLEIVKVTNISGDTLDITRGQGGTTSKAWPIGAVIAHRVVSASVEQSLQKGTERSGAYNPHGVVTASFIGEKFYDTANARHFIALGGTDWKLLTGSLVGAEYYDGNGCIVTPLILKPDTDVQKGDWIEGGGGATGNYWDDVNAGVSTPDDTSYIWLDWPGNDVRLGFEDSGSGSVGLMIELSMRCACSSPAIQTMSIKFYSGGVQKGATKVVGPGQDVEWPGGAGPAFGDFTGLQFPMVLSNAELNALEIRCNPLQFGMTCCISEIEIEGT